MKLREMLVGAGVCWLGILAANVAMTSLDERKTIDGVVRHLLGDWPFLIYFYFLVLVSVAIWEFVVERRSPKK